jgi:hypothetical protein
MIRKILLAAVLLFMAPMATAADQAPPQELLNVLEGTWSLEEWHHQGVVMRPPEMTGRWVVRDGVVVAVRHRNGPKDFESSGDYGEYKITATEWIYGYKRNQLARGPSAETAKTTVTWNEKIPMRTFKISRQGTKVILTPEMGGRWEFEGPIFTLFNADGTVLRKYKRVN